MLLLVFGVFLFLGFEQTFAFDGCPDQLPKDKFLKYRNGVCYRFYVEGFWSFLEAEKICERDNGTLLAIGDQQTHDYITGILATFREVHHPVWLGLTDANNDGKFEWIDGSDMIYTNWGRNDGSYKDHCGVLRHQGMIGIWEDWNLCKNFVLPFVCQYKNYAKPLITQAPPTKASKTTTTQAPTTPVPTCPPFVCNIDCGMDGFTVDERGCSICKCDL